MSDVRRITLDEVVRHFEELEDPRCSINRKHPLVSVVVLAVMAVLAGASGPTAIARWAALKEEFLITALDLPDGVPGKDGFRRVLLALRPEAFRACFVNWRESLRAEAAAATGVERPILAVDGKTARRSHDRKNGLGALHSVTVWASEFGLSLGQVACAAKSNEVRVHGSNIDRCRGVLGRFIKPSVRTLKNKGRALPGRRPSGSLRALTV